MGNSFKSKIASFVAIAIMLSSCGDDDSNHTNIDNEKPTVVISNLENDAIVWKMVDINIEAIDDNELDKVEIYIDEALISTLETAPYSYSWDSETAAEGLHTFKVVATDATGNKTSYSIDVMVRNILLSFQVPDNLLDENESFYIFISDDQGKTLGMSEVINGQTIEIKNSSFDGERFSVTEIYIYKIDSYKEVPMRTYSGVEPGKWSLTAYDNEEENYAGEATVEFKDIEVGFAYGIISNGESTYTSSVDGNIKSFNIKKDPSKAVVIKHDVSGASPATYKMVSDINVGSNIVSLANIDLPLLYNEIDLPASTTGYIDLYGLVAPRDLSEMYEFKQYLSDGGEERVYYPGTSFEEYYSAGSLGGENFYYEGMGFGIDDFLVPSHNVQASLGNNVLTYTASGEITLCYLTISADVAVGTGYSNWSFLLPANGEGSLIVPEIPNDIQVEIGENLSFDNYKSYGIMKLPMDSYGDFISGIANGTEGLEKSMNFGKEFKLAQYSIINDQNGGRLKKDNPISIFKKRR